MAPLLISPQRRLMALISSRKKIISETFWQKPIDITLLKTVCGKMKTHRVPDILKTKTMAQIYLSFPTSL